ncbi:ABC transporter ATP-binding protein [Caballeronia sp. LjRoot34]|uniref:ABC transporter ATP-binding protein n=1 Tax=Caballeronia sp. LjRoot34 TaxID=3342325 RepID=UPI003ECE4851
MSAPTQPILAAYDIHVAYGKTPALHGVSVEVAPGEIVALIGANGAGKSTMLRAISGLLPLSSGTITWNGNPVGGVAADRIVSSGIAHCPEERHIWPVMTVVENLALGAYLCRSRELVASRMELAFERFPRLRERRGQLAGTLSGGEQQMLAIARALMSEPRMLLLDEPSLGLSPRVAQEILDVIREINAHGVTVLLVEQNVHNALAVAERAYVFETGRVIAERSAASLLDDPQVLAAYLGG